MTSATELVFGRELEKGLFTGNILIAGFLTGQFQSYLGWKLKPLVQLSQCSLLVSHPFQGKKEKIFAEHFIFQTISRGFLVLMWD